MTAHTPGPWHFDAPYIKGCREDMYPILLDLEGSNLSDADARLIAAAPELLELVREAFRDPDSEILGTAWNHHAAKVLARIDGEGN